VIVLALIVNNTPVTGAQPHSGYAFERFHIADTGFSKRRQFKVDLRARSSGKFAPLADSGGSKCDLFHIQEIA
jgi:hypothetical protein